MNGNEAVRFGNGIKVWIILCIVVNVPTAVTNLGLGNLFMSIVGVAMVAAYIWLLLSRQRNAFYLILALVAVGFILNLVVYRVGILFSILSFLNPAITYALLRSYWNDMR